VKGQQNYQVSMNVQVSVLPDNAPRPTGDDVNFVDVRPIPARSRVNTNNTGIFDQKTAAEDAPHEFGHLIGLKDRYEEKRSWFNAFLNFFTEVDPDGGTGPIKGWETNIMGVDESKGGRVEQRNIDPVIHRATKVHEKNPPKAGGETRVQIRGGGHD
jgi:hypothetical protein